MRRGGSGRALPPDPPPLLQQLHAATEAELIAVAHCGSQPTPYGAPHPYSHPDPTTHVYGTYLDYAQHSDAALGTLSGDAPIPPPPPLPPLADDGVDIPRYGTRHFLPHTYEHLVPEHCHDLHHGTVFASVESARWGSEPDHLSPSSSYQYGGGVESTQSNAYYSSSSGSTRVSADAPSHGTHAPSHRRRHSSGLVVADPADDPSAKDDPPVAEVKPFVHKVYAMLEDPDRYQDVILWDHSGEAFFVAHNDRFVGEVLREQFQHSNIHSFTRQVPRQVYQFQRYTVAQLRSALDLNGSVASTYSGWTHPNFRRGRPDLLHHLNPRPSRARLIRKLEKQYSHARVPSFSGATSSTSSHVSAHRASSAGASSSLHSSSKTGSDTTTSPPTSSRYLPLPMDMAYSHHHVPPPRTAAHPNFGTEPMYPASESQNQHG
ncbi:hypothetical protein JCM3774_000336 [Rhodotorula dairenensis]